MKLALALALALAPACGGAADCTAPAGRYVITYADAGGTCGAELAELFIAGAPTFAHLEDLACGAYERTTSETDPQSGCTADFRLTFEATAGGLEGARLELRLRCPPGSGGPADCTQAIDVTYHPPAS